MIVLCSDLTLRFYHCSARASPNDETIKCRGAVRLRDPSFRLAWWAGSILEGLHEGSRLCFLVGPRRDVDVLCMKPFDGFDRDVRMPCIARLPPLSAHTDAVMDAIEGSRVSLGPAVLLGYTLQGLFHPARKVRETYWRVYNNLYIGGQDALVPAYPQLDDEEGNAYRRHELDMFI